MIKKTYIVSMSNFNGNTIFKCANCDRHISYHQIIGTRYCQRCGRKFKNKIKIVR